MKILVLQLARYGDVLQSLPSLNALKRLNPSAEIHLLVRERFKEVAELCSTVDVMHTVPTAKIIDPILRDIEGGENGSMDILLEFVDQLKQQGFTKIVNLSFSPFSSYLVRAISVGEPEVSGYTRYEDGFLSIPDDMSAYFYAQVGVGRCNRIHMTDIFSTLMGVDVLPEDFRVDLDLAASGCQAPLAPHVILHIGASEVEKSFSVFKWKQLLRKFVKSNPEINYYMVGSKSEVQKSIDILDGEDFSNTYNIVGQTTFKQAFTIAREARAIVGADSVFMHIGSLLNIPCINFSFGPVNLWETGPLSNGSRILYSDSEEGIPSDLVSSELNSLLNGEEGSTEVYRRKDNGTCRYIAPKRCDVGEFEWKLIQSLYIGGDFPEINSSTVNHALIRCMEVTDLAMERIQLRIDGQSLDHGTDVVFEQIDPLLLAIGKMSPVLTPLLNWFETERIRIGPGTLNTVLSETLEVFTRFKMVLSAILINQEQSTYEVNP